MFVTKGRNLYSLRKNISLPVHRVMEY